MLSGDMHTVTEELFEALPASPPGLARMGMPAMPAGGLSQGSIARMAAMASGSGPLNLVSPERIAPRDRVIRLCGTRSAATGASPSADPTTKTLAAAEECAGADDPKRWRSLSANVVAADGLILVKACPPTPPACAPLPPFPVAPLPCALAAPLGNGCGRGRCRGKPSAAALAALAPPSASSPPHADG